MVFFYGAFLISHMMLKFDLHTFELECLRFSVDGFFPVVGLAHFCSFILVRSKSGIKKNCTNFLARISIISKDNLKILLLHIPTEAVFLSAFNGL